MGRSNETYRSFLRGEYKRTWAPMYSQHIAEIEHPTLERFVSKRGEVSWRKPHEREEDAMSRKSLKVAEKEAKIEKKRQRQLEAEARRIERRKTEADAPDFEITKIKAAIDKKERALAAANAQERCPPGKIKYLEERITRLYGILGDKQEQQKAA